MAEKQLKNEVLEQIKKAFDNFETCDTGFIRCAMLEYFVSKSKAKRYPYAKITGFGWDANAEETFSGVDGTVFSDCDEYYSDEDMAGFVYDVQRAIDELIAEGKLKNIVQKKSGKPKIKNFKWGNSEGFEFTTKLTYIKPTLSFKRLQEWLKEYANVDLPVEDFRLEYFRKSIDEDEPESVSFYDFQDEISDGYACEDINNGKHYRNMLNKLKRVYVDGDKILVETYEAERITYTESEWEQYGYVETCFRIIVLDSDGEPKATIE